MSDTAEPYVRVLLAVSDHYQGRGLLTALREQPDLNVVSVVEKEQDLPVAMGDRAVDVILADARFSTAVLALRQRTVAGQGPKPRLVRLLPAGADAADGALASGAEGAVPLHAGEDQLADAVRSAYRTEVPARPGIGGLSGGVEEDDLTRREREILERVAMGMRNREIATELEIAESTVKGHVSRILDKLRVSARTQAVRIAVRRGLVSLHAN